MAMATLGIIKQAAVSLLVATILFASLGCSHGSSGQAESIDAELEDQKSGPKMADSISLTTFDDTNALLEELVEDVDLPKSPGEAIEDSGAYREEFIFPQGNGKFDEGIYRFDEATQEQVLLIDIARFEKVVVDIEVSEDGHYVAFHLSLFDDYWGDRIATDLYLYDVWNGGEPQLIDKWNGNDQVTVEEQGEFEPSVLYFGWSPDGRYLAYSSNEPWPSDSGYYDYEYVYYIYTYDTVTGIVAKLSPDIEISGKGKIGKANRTDVVHQKSVTYSGSTYFRWSPMGNYICFHVGRSSDYVANTHLATPDGQVLMKRECDGFSPNDSQLAFAEDNVLYVDHPLVSEAKRVVTPSLASDVKFHWSPDGNQLAFLVNSFDDQYSWYSYNALDSSVNKMSGYFSVSGNSEPPQWSSTGRYFYFRSFDAQAGLDFLLLSSNDGKLLERLSTQRGAVSWSPNSDFLAFVEQSNDSAERNLHLVVVDQSGELRQFESALPEDRYYNLRWSIDGSVLTVRSHSVQTNINYQFYDIHIADLESEGLLPLLKYDMKLETPTTGWESWAKEGEEFLYIETNEEEGAADILRYSLLTGQADLLYTNNSRRHLVYDLLRIYESGTEG